MAQSLLMGALVTGLLGFLFVRHFDVTNIEWIAAAHVWAFWLFPLSMSYSGETGVTDTLTRGEANLLPMVLLTARLPGVVLLTMFAVFLVFDFAVSIAFFKWVLV